MEGGGGVIRQPGSPTIPALPRREKAFDIALESPISRSDIQPTANPDHIYGRSTQSRRHKNPSPRPGKVLQVQFVTFETHNPIPP